MESRDSKGRFIEGHKESIEMRIKRGKAISKGKIGNKRSEEFKKRFSIIKQNQWKDSNSVYNSKEYRRKLSKVRSGKNCYNWKGGITPIFKKIRQSLEYKEWRKIIFERDNYTCQKENCPFCNNKQGIELNAHHKKSFAEYPNLRFVINNGITYCKESHILYDTHRGR